MRPQRPTGELPAYKQHPGSTRLLQENLFMVFERRKGNEEYWTGGWERGEGERYRGPTAVCLIASPHKRAFKAFPFPPPTMTR